LTEAQAADACPQKSHIGKHVRASVLAKVFVTLAQAADTAFVFFFGDARAAFSECQIAVTLAQAAKQENMLV
jgi:hypothetical protein